MGERSCWSWPSASPSWAAPDEQSDTPLPADCDALKKLSLPLEDAPPASMARSLKGCSSEDLYFGIGVPKDPIRARQCAYVERQDPDNGWPNLFAGTGMLMTIYANGIGAPRNFDIAMKFACELGGAPAEEEGWLAHLQKLKSENWQGQDFSPCDDITSGAAMGFCEAHEAKLAERRAQSQTCRYHRSLAQRRTQGLRGAGKSKKYLCQCGGGQ